MDQLRFTGLHEDGNHLVVTAADGSDFAVPIDDRLRSALRQSFGAPTIRANATPREVQTQIRAGLSNADVAALTGWEVERVQRYEGPILAEREHIAGLARQAPVRTHDRTGPPPSLESRVRDRLHVRGVDLDKIQWDAMRPDGGQWSVVVRFMAGQRIRQAAWTFDLSTRSVDAIDDEARWLSEDEQSLPAGAPASALFGAGMEAPDDLMSTMRERSRRRGHGQGRPRKNAAAAEQPSVGHGGADSDPSLDDSVDFDGDAELDVEAADETDLRHDTEASGDPAALPAGVTDQALPLEDLPYDPDTMGLPPAAGREAASVSRDTDEARARWDDDVEPPDDDSPAEEVLEDEDVEDVDDGDDHPEDSREATLADFFGREDIDDDDGVDEAPSAPSPPRGRKGRPSVPSWDDIMFGARDKDR
ncbi:MAG: septation protein SepH [Ornithinimicrobium sp.]